MFSKIAYILQKEKRTFTSGLLLLAAAVWFRTPPGTFFRSWTQPKPRMLAAADSAAVKEKPVDLGHLEPTGRTHADGSEIWGYPEGSELEGVLEVHVRDGRVVREVLRPSVRRSGSQVAGALR